MIESWSAAIAPFTVAVLALIVPGAVVVFAGWGARRLAVWFLAPALSLAVLAVAAVISDVVGLAWGPLPIAIVTVLVAASLACLDAPSTTCACKNPSLCKYSTSELSRALSGLDRMSCR